MNKDETWGLGCFLFLPPTPPQMLKARDLILKHIIIVRKPIALRNTLIFNEQFPNDKRAGLIKASNYILHRKKKKKRKKQRKKCPQKKERNIQVLEALTLYWNFHM